MGTLPHPGRHEAAVLLQRALGHHARELDRIDNPQEAARRTTLAIDALNVYLQHVAATRVRAIGNWRAAGASYDTIATHTGLSKSRVAQLARAARRNRSS